MVWRIIKMKVPMTKCTRRNAHSAPSHNLYGTHENSIPFLHRDLAATHFTSLSLLNQETCQMFGLWLYVAPMFAISATQDSLHSATLLMGVP